MSDYTNLISAGVAAFMAGGFALLGAWINNRSNNFRLDNQLRHESSKLKSNLIISRGEELYFLIIKWKKMVLNTDHQEMFVARGYKTREQVDAESNNDVSVDYDRMETIMSIYFPELMDAFDLARKCRMPAFEMTLGLSGEGLSGSEKVDLILKCQKEFINEMGKLLSKLKFDMSKSINI